MLTHASYVHAGGQRGVENTSTVNVRFAVKCLGDFGDFIEGGLIVACSTSKVGGVFHANKRPVWIVAARTFRFSNGPTHLFGRHEAAHTVDQAMEAPQRAAYPPPS